MQGMLAIEFQEGNVTCYIGRLPFSEDRHRDRHPHGYRAGLWKAELAGHLHLSFRAARVTCVVIVDAYELAVGSCMYL